MQNKSFEKKSSVSSGTWLFLFAAVVLILLCIGKETVGSSLILSDSVFL